MMIIEPAVRGHAWPGRDSMSLVSRRMQKREKILSGIAIGCGLFFVVNQFVCTGTAPEENIKAALAPMTDRQDKPKAPVAVRETISNEELESRLENWKPVVTYEQWGRDPFRGALKLEQEDSSADSIAFRLSGIVHNGSTALALIDDYIVRQGEKTEDFEVVRILPDRVILRHAGKLVTLHLDQEKKAP